MICCGAPPAPRFWDHLHCPRSCREVRVSPARGGARTAPPAATSCPSIHLQQQLPTSRKALENKLHGRDGEGKTDGQTSLDISCRTHPMTPGNGVTGSRGRWRMEATPKGRDQSHNTALGSPPHRGRSVLLCRVFREVPSSLGRALCKLDMAAVFLRSMMA